MRGSLPESLRVVGVSTPEKRYGGGRFGGNVGALHRYDEKRRNARMALRPRIAALCGHLSLLAAIGLAGCSSSVVVQSDFPAPLVEPLPVRMGVIFDDELHNYIYYEELPQHTAWTIDMGSPMVNCTKVMAVLESWLFSPTT
jgi:hypothetical protein